ncbi:hypothetical protein AG4045_016549 [Apium graveolens]|uniref:N-acetyltransferase domain-containing protein n=1 Tax=Apium graveolens TaxID=4045 RepID=A0A6L5B8G8_APIGR|nr:hypothetical protein AG4045_016549 [Apium graveolens]
MVSCTPYQQRGRNIAFSLSCILRPQLLDSDLYLLQGAKADHARAYISNVCVAEELYRNGLGYSLVTESKRVAEDWGISDLYVHVAFDNEAAKNLYIKTGFVHENDEPAWQARFLDRPRRILLWSDLSKDYV